MRCRSHESGGDSGTQVRPIHTAAIGRNGSSIVGFLGSLLGSLVGAKAGGGGESDARGTDPVLTEQRTRVAITAAHNPAVGTGFQVQQEHLKRTPQR